MTNNKMYTDEEMREEIREWVEELGGFMKHVEGQIGQGSGLQLYVSPGLVEQANLLINDIRIKYERKRRALRTDDPFSGIKEFLN